MKKDNPSNIFPPFHSQRRARAHSSRTIKRALAQEAARVRAQTANDGDTGIILKQWYGRLGNNIVQICNIIDIALTYKHKVCFKVKHKLFNLKIITDFFSKYNNNAIITAPKGANHFFTRGNLPYPIDIYKKNHEEKINLLKKSFLIKNINKLNIDELVVHIRSGDVFNEGGNAYIPPPLSYYIKGIDKHKYKKIILVCEDKKNPVVDKLLSLYKNAIYNKNSLEQDIKLILGATNIIWSVGTFVPSLLLMSNNIKYTYNNKRYNNDYLKIMKPWKNTKEQRDYMLTYKYD